VGGNGAGQYPDRGVIVVTQSRPQFRFLFGFLIVVFALALVRGVAGASTVTGRVAIAVISGILLAGSVVGLVFVTRRVDRLEVTEDAITYVTWSGQHKAVLSREWGDEIRLDRRLYGGRLWIEVLTIPGTGKTIDLMVFPRDQVRRACLARGWRLDAGK
jgi:hypothetical protein